MIFYYFFLISALHLKMIFHEFKQKRLELLANNNSFEIHFNFINRVDDNFTEELKNIFTQNDAIKFLHFFNEIKNFENRNAFFGRIHMELYENFLTFYEFCIELIEKNLF